MRVFSTVLKVAAAVAAVVGAVYIAATYGDQIVSWAKKMLSKCPCHNPAPEVEEVPAEEAPAEEAPVEEAPVEEAPVEEAPAEESAPVADENDFEG